jgi:SAM-dependent methyltransferase
MASDVTGSVTTPPAVASAIAARALELFRAAGDGRVPRILDPGCGNGAFLCAALGELSAHHTAAAGATAPPVGIEIDPARAESARQRLAGRPVEVRTGDVFDLLENGDRFDVVIGNPPYVSYFSRGSAAAPGTATRPGWISPDRRRTLGRRLGLGDRRFSLFAAFTALALRLRRPGGVVALLLPDTVTTNAAYAGLRAQLADAGIAELWRFSEPVWPAEAVFSCVPIVAPVADRDAAGPAGLDVTVHRAAASAWRDAAEAGWAAITTATASTPWLTAMCDPERTVALEGEPGSPGLVRDGINPGSRAVRETLIRPTRHGADPRPVLRGRHIAPYRLTGEPAEWVDLAVTITPAQRRAGASLRDPTIWRGPKLVSRQTARRPIVAPDTGELAALNSVHTIRAAPGAPAGMLDVLLGWLNSTPLAAAYQLASGETRRTFPQVHISRLRRLRLPRSLATDSPDLRSLQALVGRRLAAADRPSASTDLDVAIDHAVAAAYGLSPADLAAITAAVVT